MAHQLHFYADGYSMSVPNETPGGPRIESDVVDFGELLEFDTPTGQHYIALVDVDENTDEMYSVLGDWIIQVVGPIPDADVEIVEMRDDEEADTTNTDSMIYVDTDPAPVLPSSEETAAATPTSDQPQPTSQGESEPNEK